MIKSIMVNQSERNKVHGMCGCCTGLKKAFMCLLRKCRKMFKRNTSITTTSQEDDLNGWVIIEKISPGDWQEAQLPLTLSEEREERQGCSTEAEPLVPATERCNPAPSSHHLEEPVIAAHLNLCHQGLHHFPQEVMYLGEKGESLSEECEVEQQQDSCMQLAHHQDSQAEQQDDDSTHWNIVCTKKTKKKRKINHMWRL